MMLKSKSSMQSQSKLPTKKILLKCNFKKA